MALTFMLFAKLWLQDVTKVKDVTVKQAVRTVTARVTNIKMQWMDTLSPCARHVIVLIVSLASTLDQLHSLYFQSFVN